MLELAHNPQHASAAAWTQFINIANDNERLRVSLFLRGLFGQQWREEWAKKFAAKQVF